MRTHRILAAIAALGLAACAPAQNTITPQGRNQNGTVQTMQSGDTLSVPGLATITGNQTWGATQITAANLGSVTAVDVLARNGSNVIGLVAASSLGAPAFGVINTPAGTDPTATVVTDTLNLTLSGGATNSITGNSGTKTVDFGIHDPVTLAASATSILDLSTQVIGFDTQAAGTFLAGPVSGAPAAPTFRAITGSDLPSAAFAFGTVDVPTGTDPVATSLADTLTFAASGDLTVVGSAVNTVTFTNTQAAVTLDANAATVLNLTGQQLGLDTQTANFVWAGPTTGSPAVPTFRALVAADLPASPYDGTYLRLDTTNNPLTGDLDFANDLDLVMPNSTAGDGIRLLGASSSIGLGDLTTATNGQIALASDVNNAGLSPYILVTGSGGQVELLASASPRMKVEEVGTGVFASLEPSTLQFSDGTFTHTQAYDTLTGNRTATWTNATGDVVVTPWNAEFDITASSASSILDVTNSGTGLAATFVGGSDGEAVQINGSGASTADAIVRIDSSGTGTGIEINAVPRSLFASGGIVSNGGLSSIDDLTVVTSLASNGTTTIGNAITDSGVVNATVTSSLGDVLINDDLDVWISGAASLNTFSSYNSTAPTVNADVAIDRYRGTRAAPTTISNGDVYGGIRFRGYDGTTIENAAYLYAQASGGSVSGTSMPGTVFLQTTTNGTNTLNTSMQWDPFQRVNIRQGQSTGTNVRLGGVVAGGQSTVNGGTLGTLGTVATYTLPASAFANNGDMLRLKFFMIANSNVANRSVRLQIDGTNVYTRTAAAAASLDAQFEVTIRRVDATNYRWFVATEGDISAWETTLDESEEYGAGTVANWTSSRTINWQASTSTASASEFQLVMWYAEYFPAP